MNDYLEGFQDGIDAARSVIASHLLTWKRPTGLNYRVEVGKLAELIRAKRPAVTSRADQAVIAERKRIIALLEGESCGDETGCRCLTVEDLIGVIERSKK